MTIEEQIQELIARCDAGIQQCIRKSIVCQRWRFWQLLILAALGSLIIEDNFVFRKRGWLIFYSIYWPSIILLKDWMTRHSIRKWREIKVEWAESKLELQRQLNEWRGYKD